MDIFSILLSILLSILFQSHYSKQYRVAKLKILICYHIYVQIHETLTALLKVTSENCFEFIFLPPSKKCICTIDNLSP